MLPRSHARIANTTPYLPTRVRVLMRARVSAVNYQIRTPAHADASFKRLAQPKTAKASAKKQSAPRRPQSATPLSVRRPIMRRLKGITVLNSELLLSTARLSASCKAPKRWLAGVRRGGAVGTDG